MRIYTLALSVVAHLLVVIAVIVVPLVATDALPLPRRAVEFVHVAAPPVIPPPPLRARPPEVSEVPASTDLPIQEPIGFEPEPPAVPSDPYEAAPSVIDGTFIATVGPAPTIAPPEPREVPPVRVGGTITRPSRVHEVAPSYPAVARAARIEGTVILEAVIDNDGTVRDVRVLRSVPLLDQAATDAVRQWRFTPTLLNGEAVPVVMTVTVTFRLQ